MILVDSGPLVALIDRGERRHMRCVEVLEDLILPMVTTWPAFTEAMYLLGRGGWYAQSLLWQLVLGGDLVLGTIEAPGLARIHALMAQYRDTPMDFADASLVVYAEQLGATRIFTLDSHFQAYRLHDRQRLDIVP